MAIWNLKNCWKIDEISQNIDEKLSKSFAFYIPDEFCVLSNGALQNPIRQWFWRETPKWYFSHFPETRFRHKCLFPQNQWEVTLWYWCLVIVLASTRSQKKNASKRLKARRRNISWRWSKTCSKQAKNMIFSKISMQAYISVERIWKILRKPFLQCFTIRCIFSALRVIAEKPPSKAIFNFCGPWWLKAYSQFLLISLKGEHKQSLRVKHKLQFVTLMQI